MTSLPITINESPAVSAAQAAQCVSTVLHKQPFALPLLAREQPALAAVRTVAARPGRDPGGELARQAAEHRLDLACADAYYKLTKVRDHAAATGRALWTFLLPCSGFDHAAAKAAWKRFSERCLAGRGVMAFGVCEREVTGEHTGELHLHALLALPPALQPEASRFAFADEMRRVWCGEPAKCDPGGKVGRPRRVGVHELFFGCPSRPHDMTLTRPHDAECSQFLGYISKMRNRSAVHAKWGKPPRASIALSANVPAGLWHRDELPSRWTRAQGDPICWLRRQLKGRAAAA